MSAAAPDTTGAARHRYETTPSSFRACSNEPQHPSAEARMPRMIKLNFTIGVLQCFGSENSKPHYSSASLASCGRQFTFLLAWSVTTAAHPADLCNAKSKHKSL